MKFPDGFFSVGAIIAIVVLVVAIVFMAIGKGDIFELGLIAALAIARLT